MLALYSFELIKSRIMTRKQIAKKAEEIAWQTSKHYDPNASKQEWCHMAAIDMAYWMLSHQWVSVEEELPPLEKDVIVNFKWRNIENKRFGHRTDRSEVVTDKNGFATFNDDEIITHWMPIPPLAEEGGEND